MRVDWHCPFSCETENEATAAILILSILINRSYLHLNALKLAIYTVGLVFRVCKSIGIKRFHARSKPMLHH